MAPAKLYYEKFGVTFPALVDPNYATGFGAVPKTFFINSHGIVQELRDWESRFTLPTKRAPITAAIRRQWSRPEQRLDTTSLAALAQKHAAETSDLATAIELGSRYLDLQLTADAERVLKSTISRYDARHVGRSGERDQMRLLGQAYLQLSRAMTADREAQVEFATLSYYLNPSVGFGKQIARIIAPEKFDSRDDGSFDNRFREGTLRRLQSERRIWFSEE